MVQITHSEKEQNSIFSGLIDEQIKQGQIIATPQVPGAGTVATDGSTTQPAKISDATKNGPVAKLPQNTLMNAIANQGQLLPIPQVTSDNSDSLKEIKNAINQVSGQVNDTAQAADTTKKDSGGGGFDVSSLIESAAMSFIGWIICTELMRQGKMPRKWWVKGGPVFAEYPDVVKQGYYLWAIPCVAHLRRYPNSILSHLLCVVFNWRAQSIAEKTTFRGSMVTLILWPICFILGTGLKLLNQRLDWLKIYGVR